MLGARPVSVAADIPFAKQPRTIFRFLFSDAGSRLGLRILEEFNTMSAILCEAPDRAAEDSRCGSEAAVQTQVWRLLSGMYPNGNRIERRQEQRYPYPRLISLLPMKADGVTPDGEPLTVAGKHISEGGLGFFHQQPISHRLAVVSLEASDGRWLGFLLDVHRCRFTRHGWYESGGKFLRAVASPLAVAKIA